MFTFRNLIIAIVLLVGIVVVNALVALPAIIQVASFVFAVGLVAFNTLTYGYLLYMESHSQK